MITIGLIREEKIPQDNRVALTPAHCRWIHQQNRGVAVVAQSSETRCYKDKEYEQAGIKIVEQLDQCDILMGIKEVPVDKLIPHKTYLLFSHTKKQQSYNKQMFRAMIEKKITLIDYECLTYEDGQRLIGFGFFAGVVGAHNGMMAYGNRTGLYHLKRIKGLSLNALVHQYFGLKLPPIKIAVTGSGRVAKGIIEVMNLMDIQEVATEDYLTKKFSYPVYVHLKGSNLYQHKNTGKYLREDFHAYPQQYNCLFEQYYPHTDILMNGIYWEAGIPRLFEMNDLQKENFSIQTIADITDDINGSVPCNVGSLTLDEPIYGIDKFTGIKTTPYLPNSIDVMAVSNLPNELPRDASRYFSEQLIKYVLEEIIKPDSALINRAMILKKGELTEPFRYLSDYATCQ